MAVLPISSGYTGYTERMQPENGSTTISFAFRMLISQFYRFSDDHWKYNALVMKWGNVIW